jgi:hypothetical protein
MAIEYGNYAALQAGQPDLSPIAQGVENWAAKSKEVHQRAASQFNEEAWAEIMQPFQQASFKDVSSWNPSLFANQNAGFALAQFKKKALQRGERFYDALQEQGAFNPVTFKQQFDQIRSTYMPGIEQKLEQFQNTQGWNDREMQQWIGGSPGLQNFILDFGDPAGTMREKAKPWTPSGFIGGTTGELMRNPLEHSMALGAVPAGIGAIKGAYTGKSVAGALEGAKKGLASTYQLAGKPLATKASLKSYAKLLADKGYGTETEKSIQKGITGLEGKRGELRKLQQKGWNSYLKDNKLKHGKYVKSTMLDPKTGKVTDFKDILKKPKSAQAKALANMTKAEKAAFNKYKGLSKAQKSAQTSWRGGQKKTTGLLNKSRKQLMRQHGKVGGAAMSNIKRAFKKHGTKRVIGILASHVGWPKATMMAAKLVGGSLLTGSGIGTVAGLAMNAWTIASIAKILKEALHETPITANPAKLAFGGTTSDPTYKRRNIGQMS